MMDLLLMIVPLVGILVTAMAIAVLSGTRVARALPVGAALPVAVLYVFALMGFVRVGLIAVWVLIIACAVFCCVQIARKKAAPAGRGAASLLLGVFFAAGIYINAGRMFINWDEFTHWGLAARSIVELNVLGTAPQNLMHFKDYPPMQTLFIYFFHSVSSAFSEGGSYLAICMLYACIIAPLWDRVQGKAKRVLALLLFFVLPAFLFEGFYCELYVDAMLGVLLGVALVTYLFAQQGDKKSRAVDTAAFAGYLFMLTLLKGSGTALAVLAVLICLFTRPDKKMIGAGALSVALAKGSWSIHLNIMGIGDSWDASAALSGMGLNEAQRGTVLKFMRAFAEEVLCSYYFSLTCFMALVIFMTCMWLLWRNNKESALARMGTGVSMGFILYAISLLVLYLFAYRTYEMVKLASFTRYMNTYVLALAMVAASIAAIQLPKESCTGVIVALLSLCVFSNAGYFMYSVATAPVQAKKTHASRLEQSEIDRIKRDVGEEGRLYILSSIGGDYDWWMIRYELMLPADQINPVGTSNIHTQENDEKETSTAAIRPEEWIQQLGESYTHVYVDWYAKSFAQDYGHLFEDGLTSRTLYRVMTDKEEPYLLKAE